MSELKSILMRGAHYPANGRPVQKGFNMAILTDGTSLYYGDVPPNQIVADLVKGDIDCTKIIEAMS